MTAAAVAIPADARRAIGLCATARGLGGMILRGRSDAAAPLIDAFVAALPAGSRVRRLPICPRDDQLDGGIDLAAALAGRPAPRRPGLLEDTDMLVVPMAERLSPAIAARIATAMDAGLLVAALTDEDVPLPAVLVDRMAFSVDVDQNAPADGDAAGASDDVPPDDALEALATAAIALGIASPRGEQLALRVARGLARQAGRALMSEADLADAVRLVLIPRATRLPAPDEASAPSPAPEAPPPPGNDQSAEQGGPAGELADRVLDAAEAAIDPALLAAIIARSQRRGEGRMMRGPGERRRSQARGRPIGVRAGDPRSGARLALVETLRQAAPWQRLRGRTDRVLVRKDDLRVQRREARTETVAIFAVDASGSAAMARLAEAKGAVELLLAQAYVQRSEVALIAFRGPGAELLLPPTRSLTRARRALADLPGGGGTPLADGIAAALRLAGAVRARGRTPMVVLLSDGRGNLAAGGIAAGREAAGRDAMAAARSMKAERVPAVFVDTSPRPRAEGADLAAAMGARYVPLPFAGMGGARLSSVVEAFAARPL